MPLWLVYRQRPCGSTCRRSDRWTIEQLQQLTKDFGLSSEGTIDQLCRRLIDYDMITIGDVPPEPVPEKPKPMIFHKPKNHLWHRHHQ